jgi:hypothetical protein
MLGFETEKRLRATWVYKVMGDARKSTASIHTSTDCSRVKRIGHVGNTTKDYQAWQEWHAENLERKRKERKEKKKRMANFMF